MKNTAKWIRHTHVFRKDEYVCPACGGKTESPKGVCPNCGQTMKGTQYDPSWVDEITQMDLLSGDD